MGCRAIWIVSLCSASCAFGDDGGLLDASVVAMQTQHSVSVEATADSGVKQLAPDRRFGYEPTLDVREDAARALLRFDTSAVVAAGVVEPISSAVVSLTITRVGLGDPSDRSLALHRLERGWVEAGATWRCVNDSNVENFDPDCSTEDMWELEAGGNNPWVSTPIATAIIPELAAGETAVVTLDVTSDLVDFVAGSPNNGWIVLESGTTGLLPIAIASRETASPPTLEVSYSSAEPPPDPLDPVELGAVGLGADTYIRPGLQQNRNFGGETTLDLASLTRRRVLLHVETSALEALLAGQGLGRAELELDVTDVSSGWGAGGSISLHRLTQPFEELGATWNCADDQNTSNFQIDCDAADTWEMGISGPAPWDPEASAVAILTSTTSGTLTLDVTEDVAAFIDGGPNHGWILKRANELSLGNVDFASRESGSGPRVVLAGGCEPETDEALCTRLGASCGDVTATDNCGASRTVTCGDCLAPETCGGGGQPNVCGCTPTTCTASNAECGDLADGCGGVIDCGACNAPDTCGGGGVANTCGCTPTTCASEGANCGPLADGCGSTLLCGDCVGPEVCGGGGQPGVCDCTPTTCEAAGVTCGTISDGCGDVLSCGSCQPPELAPIGDQIVQLGTTLALDLDATDPDGDALRFSASPLPLPDNATLDGASGVFTFRPDAEQVGSFAITFEVSDGALSDSELVTITVANPTPGGDTSVRGQILDTNDFVDGTITPIAGATVSFPDSGVSAMTDMTGVFEISGLAPGKQIIDIDTTTAMPAPDGSSYAGFREAIDIIGGVENVFERPFFLPRIDPDGTGVVDPTQTTIISNPNLGVSIEIPPHTAKNPDGSDFAGEFSISAVPASLAPVALPSFLEPDLLLTLQPVGVTFATPVPITFPNTNQLAPGSELDIWSLDPAIGQFVVVGLARVSADGQTIETISGGIVSATWHAMLPVGVAGTANNEQDCAFCAKKTGSQTSVATGDLKVAVRLPSHVSQGRVQTPALNYSSRSADPRPILTSTARVLARSAVPNLVSTKLMVGDVEMTSRQFTDTSGLDEGLDEEVYFAVQWDASSLVSGVYGLVLELTAHFTNIGDSAVTTEIESVTFVNNEKLSPFGAGWSFGGVGRVFRQEGISEIDDVLIVEDGETLLFRAQPAAISPVDVEITDPDWFLTSRFNHPRAQSAHLSPVDGRVYVGTRTFATEGGGLFRIDDPESPATRLHVGHFTNGIAIDPDDGDIFVSDEDGGTNIWRTGFGATGRQNWVVTFMVPPNRPLGLTVVPSSFFGTTVAPGTGLAVMAEGVIGLYSFDPDGGPFQQPIAVSTGGLFVAPRDVAVTSDSVYVVDASAGIIRVEPDGGQTAIATTSPLDTPIGIAADPRDGSLYVQELGGQRIVRVAPATGEVTELIRGFEFLASSWAGIDFVAEGVGEVIVSDSGRERVYRFVNQPGFTAPPGDFSRLTESAFELTRTFKDGTVVRYDVVGRQVSSTDANGNVTQWNYASGDLASIVDPVGRATTFDYSGEHLASITDPAGRTTQFEHDSAGNLVRVLLSDGSERRFTYDSRNRMTSQVDPRGFTTQYSYDAFGRHTNSTRADGSLWRITAANTVGLAAEAESTRENPAPVIRPDEVAATFVDGAGRTREYETGPLGAVERFTDTAGLDTTANRDVNAQVSNIQLPSGHAMSFTHDTAGNRVTQSDQTIGGLLRWTYRPPLNTLTEITDPDNNVTSFDYSPTGNLVESRSPTGLVSTFDHDARGNPISVIDSLGTETTTAYDAFDNPVETRRGAGTIDERLEIVTHSPEGYIDSVTDALGQITRFEFDARGRPVRQILADGRAIEVGYDLRGNVTSVTPPGRPTHMFAYTQTGLVESYTPPDVGLPNRQTRFAYNGAGQLSSVAWPDGEVVSIGRDSAGRVEQLSAPSELVTFGYNPAGQVESIGRGSTQLGFTYLGDLMTSVGLAGPVAGQIGATYDESYRITSLEVAGTAPIPYSYNADGALTVAGALTLTRDPATGLVTQTQIGDVIETWSYNQFGEPISYAAEYQGTELLSFDYTVDAVGRIVAVTETITGTTQTLDYRFDLTGRLDQITEDGFVIDGFVYDENDNRLSELAPGTDATFDAQDRLITRGPETFTYTPAGELSSRTTGTETTTFEHDALETLRAVNLPDDRRIEYIVDGLGRRIGKRIDGVLVQGFLYKDGLNPVAELDGAGSIVSLFVYGTRPNVPDYMIRGTATYRILADRRGSPRLVIDIATGAITARIDYDTFGGITAETFPGLIPFGLAGGIHDRDTELVLFGTRNYAPELGRFITKEPRLFEDAVTNAYVYAANDPVNNIDLDGLLVDSVSNACRSNLALCAALGFGVAGTGAALLSQPHVGRAAVEAASTCIDGIGAGFDAASDAITHALLRLHFAARTATTALGVVLAATALEKDWDDVLEVLGVWDVLKQWLRGLGATISATRLRLCQREFVRCLIERSGGQDPWSLTEVELAFYVRVCYPTLTRCVNDVRGAVGGEEE
jgi:RHS repeat-associated protein